MDARIQLEVWAGALGVPIIRKNLDAGTLSAEKRGMLHQLILAAGILDLPSVSPPSPTLRDANQTKLVLDVAGKTKTVRVFDVDLSPAQRELIEFVKQHGS